MDYTSGDPFVERPGVGEGSPAGGADASAAGSPPEYVPKAQFDEVASRVERYKALDPIVEAMSDPATANRIRAAIYGSGAPPVDASGAAPVARPTVDQQRAEIKGKYAEKRKAAMQAGDWETVGSLTAEEGEELGYLRARSEFEATSGNISAMAANTALQSWLANKRATSALFQKLESKMQEKINRTAPEMLADMARKGQLIPVLDRTWNDIIAENQESAYNKAAAAGSLSGTPLQVAPPYSMGNGGGTAPAREQTPALDEKDDDAFRKLMQERGITIGYDERTGVYTGEMR